MTTNQPTSKAFPADLEARRRGQRIGELKRSIRVAESYYADDQRSLATRRAAARTIVQPERRQRMEQSFDDHVARLAAAWSSIEALRRELEALQQADADQPN